MAFVLELHSILRWGIVVVGLTAIVKYIIGLINKALAPKRIAQIQEDVQNQIKQLENSNNKSKIDIEIQALKESLDEEINKIQERATFGKFDRGLSAGFSGLMDLQVTLGLILFFWSGLTGGGFPMFRIEHLTIMLVAAILGHLPTFMKKSQNKFAVALTAVVGALLLVFVGVARLPGGWSR